MQMRSCYTLAGCVMLACCASPKVTEADEPPPDLVEAIVVVPSLTARDVMMGRVTGVSCQTGVLTQSKISEDEALANAKKKAARIGASGIYRVRYGQTGLLDGCGGLKGVQASGMAFRRG